MLGGVVVMFYLCGCCHAMCRTAICIAAALDVQTIDPWRGSLPAKLIHLLLACQLAHCQLLHFFATPVLR